LFGINITGFNQFQLQPFLPAGWQKMALKHIRALQDNFDIDVERKNKQYHITVQQDNGTAQQFIWDGLKPITVVLK